MPWPRDPHRAWRRLLRLPVDDEVADELALHLALRTRDYVARGMTPEAAREAALRRFGDVATTRQQCVHIAQSRERDMRRTEWWAELWQDLTYARRQLARAPGFTLIAVLTLALGIGATTAIFSAVDAVVLRPLRFAEPERVVRFRSTAPGSPWEKGNFSPGEFATWRREGRAWDRLAVVYPGDFTLAAAELPERVLGARVSADYFAVFGVRPALGRVFAADEDRPGAPRVAVLSDRLWRRSFGARRDALTRTIELNGVPHAVIGVMPASFDVTADSHELWVPATLSAEALASFGGRYLEVVGRLRAGATPVQAQAEADAIARASAAARPRSDDDAGRVGRVLPYATDLAGEARAQLLVLLGAVGLVLLIACVNVANLLAARGLARARELTIRAALGAGRGRIVRQLLAESALLASLGTVAGLAVAYGGVALITRFVPAGVPRIEQTRLDGDALLVALGLALFSTLVLSLLPARQSGRGDLLASLRQGSRSAGASVRSGPRSALVTAEVALALVLLVGAGLLIRSALLLRQVPAGVDARDVLTARVRLPRARYPEPERVALTFQQLADAAAAVPGTTRAAVVSRVPLAGMNTGVGFVPAGDAAALQADTGVESNFRLVSPGYFATMGIRLVAGRDFTRTDGPGAPRAVVVNQTLARQLGLGARPDGRRIWSTNSAFWYEQPRPVDLVVVGVVGDIRDDGRREPVRPEAYFPIAQAPAEPWEWLERSMVVVARTAGEPASLAPALQQAVLTVDPQLPLYDVRTMARRLDDETALDRFYTGLLVALGGAALLLAAVGIYGVVSHLVSRQAAEVGLRMALGATAGSVLRLMLARHLRPVAVGIAIGGVASLFAARALASRLYGVPPTDPLTLLAAALVLSAVAGVACWLPSRRAARTDPTVVLRAE